MDALEFLRERKRMCKSFGGYCDGCPLNGKPCTISAGLDDGDCKRIVTIVEQWSKEYPCKTRQSVFLEQYPDVVLDKDGVITICPIPLSSIHRTRDGSCAAPDCICTNCRREFWLQEVE